MHISPDNTVTIMAAVVTVVGTIVGVVIANRLTYVRSSKEKIWDLRRVAYSQILSELGSIERICDIADEYISETGSDEYWETKARQNHDNEIARRMQNTRSYYSDYYLILSRKFIEAYDGFVREARSDPYNSLPEEKRDILADAVRKHRTLLIALARDDMNIKS
jgi:hypothetical protein